ncbi:MAG: DinB family protein [Acidobacteria bacterium]|nr:DinB family protein [Acidobacteriota bacterium]
MLQNIRRIYEYHDWANHNVLDTASKLTISEQEVELGGSFSTFMETLRHILMVEFLFIRRWQELPPRQEPEWKTIDQMRDSWLAIETERNQFLSDLEETMLSKMIHYADTRGRAVTLELWQAIFQCVNHSTFHRGQLMEKLRKLGKIPPTTDFVLFCRGIDK